MIYTDIDCSIFFEYCDNNLKGSISLNGEDNETISTIEFDPTLFLSELLEDNNSSLATLGTNFTNWDTYSNDLLSRIKEVIINNHCISKKDINLLEKEFHINYSYTISYLRYSPLLSKKKNKDVYTNERSKTYNINKTNYRKPHLAVYEVYTVSEFIMAVLHYLTFHKYEFIRCLHCQKYFFRNNTSIKYCNRVSPLKGYEQYNCRTAKNNYLRLIRDKKKSKYNTLNNYYENQLTDFLDEYAKQNDIVKHSPTPKNLYDLLNVVNNYPKR